MPLINDDFALAVVKTMRLPDALLQCATQEIGMAKERVSRRERVKTRLLLRRTTR
jgi:hypothetical protein